MAAIALLATVAVSSSVAQSARGSPERKAERAVELRQSLFHIVNYAYAPLSDMIKKKAPFDADVAQKSASVLSVLAPLVVDTFKADTRAFNVKTWARDDIWLRFQDFQSKNASFTKAVGALTQAARSRDEKATLQSIVAVGKSCSACHDEYTR